MNCNSVSTNVTINSLGEEEMTIECLSCFDEFLLDTINSESFCTVLQPFQKEINTSEAQNDICELRNPENELCLSCPESYIFDSEFKNCVSSPTGVPNCEIYLNSNVCSYCKSGYFLNQNQCLLVTNSISDCFWYSGDGECSQCKGGFKLKIETTTNNGNNEVVTSCEANSVLNCVSYDDQSGLCKECDPNYYLIRVSTAPPNPDSPKIDFSDQHIYNCKEQNVDNCIQYADNIGHFYTPSDITQNEINYFEVTEFPSFLYEDTSFLSSSICQQCAPGFFLNNNSCHIVETDTIIDNCLEYISKTTCKRCVQDFILTKEK